MREITKYETSDLKIFDTAGEAHLHEQEIKLSLEIEDFACYGELSIDQVIEFLEKNKDSVLEYYARLKAVEFKK